MTITTGHVKADGTSAALPEGVYDMASLGLDKIDPELEEKIAKLVDPSLGKESAARFKLEIFFRAGPRHNVPVRGIVSAWTNGGFMNGGGDAIVYFCPHKQENGMTCLTPIDVALQGGGRVVCVKCKQISHTKQLVGQIIADLEMYKWAAFVTRFFYLLECSADIRVSIERGSMQKAIELEQERANGGEAYRRVEAKREWITYPLTSLIKDTASGATLEGRIKAFLEA
jgi:hypothetical protein